MKKINNRTVIITTLLTLSPVIIGLLLWIKLPEQVPTHFGFDGQPDSWSSRTFAVFGLPLILLLVHLICVKITDIDPKGENITGKIYGLTLWITPVVSLFVSVITYSHALGYELNVNFAASVMTGMMFIVIGNYLPKFRQNYTIGIKIPWTLADEDNWNRTHRMAGPLWMAGGLVIMLSGLITGNQALVMLLVLPVITLVPVLYSYHLHRQKQS